MTTIIASISLSFHLYLLLLFLTYSAKFPKKNYIGNGEKYNEKNPPQIKFREKEENEFHICAKLILIRETKAIKKLKIIILILKRKNNITKLKYIA